MYNFHFFGFQFTKVFFNLLWTESYSQSFLSSLVSFYVLEFPSSYFLCFGAEIFYLRIKTFSFCLTFLPPKLNMYVILAFNLYSFFVFLIVASYSLNISNFLTYATYHDCFIAR